MDFEIVDHCEGGACSIKPRGAKATLPRDKYPSPIGWCVYGAAWCSFCTKAKLLLQTAGLEFKYIDVAEIDIECVREALSVQQSTIPLIFRDGVLIGGFSELESFMRIDATLAPPAATPAAKSNEQLLVPPRSPEPSGCCDAVCCVK